MNPYRYCLFAICASLLFTTTDALAATAVDSNVAPEASSQTSPPNIAWLGPEKLFVAYQTMQPQMQASNIEEPFSLKAHVFDALTQGDVYAVVPYDYKLLADTLTVPENVCHAIILHINVKGCVTDHPDQHQAVVDLYVGRKEYQHPQKAVKVQYAFTVGDHQKNYTLVSMTADKGPLSTENIAIHIEFLPIDAHSSFIHFAYSANYGNLARFALNTYLSTLGRNKVGFSELGIDKNGDPVYIKGIEGVVERNTMRYFFALHSYFSTYHEPENQRFDASLNRWFDYVEKYPTQLYEVPRDEYLKAKHQESLDAGEIKPGSQES